MFNLENAIDYIEESIKQLSDNNHLISRNYREQRIIGIIDLLALQKLITLEQNMDYRKQIEQK